MKLKLLIIAATALAIGCTSNPKAIKSTAAKETVPITGEAAKAQASSLAVARSGPAKGKRDDRLEAVALFPGPAMPTGVTVSKNGRIFLCFPRWNDPVKNTVVELRDGKLVPFPDAKVNAFDGTDLSSYSPADHFVSVQSVVMDAQDRLWIVDPGSFNFAPNLFQGPKLWAYDINTGQRVKAIRFPTDVAMKMSYLNDVRIDLNRGTEGTAYLTDSNVGGIVVVDIATGNSWRHLDRHPSVVPTPGLKQQSEGQEIAMRKPTGEHMALDVRSDGIALSPDGKTLYYTPLASRDVYSVPTDLLMDRSGDAGKVAAGVKKVATKPSGNDGLICDAEGRIYSTDFEDGAIRRTDPASGNVELVSQDERLLWPDTFALHNDQLYVVSNQLARQPNFHFGKDQRKPPYALFRIRIDGQSKMAAR